MLLCAPVLSAQDHTAAMQDLPNTFSATNTFQGQLFTSLVQYTVAGLPNPTSQQVGVLVIVLDGTTTLDCSVGGGTFRAICRNTGSIWEPLGGSSGGGGGTPGAPTSCFQFNNGGAFAGASGICTPDGKSLVIKGTDPWADITAFGAKATGTTVFPTTTATCTGTSCTLISAVFNIGDGITIRGAGASNTMSTPAQPSSVTPVLANGGVVPDAPYVQGVNGTTGATSYSYKVVARDKFGALTLPSTAKTISNGLSTLGLTTLTVSTLARSGTTITVTTTGTQLLVAGALIHMYGSTNAQFDGWFNVATATNGSNTFTVTNTPMDTAQGAATSATGGVVSYYNANLIRWNPVTGAWEYYICASRPGDSGAYHLIGTSAPTQQTGNHYTITSFFDYGATVLSAQTYPAYVTDSICTAGSPTNDPLTTTVANVSGLNITLASAALNAVTGATAVYDAAPAILAAANSINSISPAFTGGSIYLPPTPAVGQFYGYVVNSYLKLPSGVNIIQSGNLLVNETIEFPGNANWSGNWNATGNNPGLFAFGSWAETLCMTANPCLYSNGTGRAIYENLTIASSNTNGGNLWLTDDAYNLTWRNVSMDGAQNASTDFISKPITLRSTQTGGDLYHFDTVSFSGGPNQVNDASWTPLFYIPASLTSSQATNVNNTLVDMKSVFFNSRGMEWDLYGGAYDLNLNWGYRQGGITPFLILFNGSGLPGGPINLTHLTVDTEVQPLVSNLGAVNAAFIRLSQDRSGGDDVGGVPPSISGFKPDSADFDQSYVTYTQGLGVETHDNNGFSSSVVTANYNFQCPENATPPSGIANVDILYCDATAHAFKVINNNGAASPLGTMGGTLAANQICYGLGSNACQGSNSLEFDGTTVTNTAAGGFLQNLSQFAETTAPSAAAGKDILYGDSSAHVLELSVNNGSFQILPAINGATIIGHCVQFAAGPTVVDSGASCGGGSGGANVALSNLAGVGINTTLLPGSINTVALGSTSLPFTNSFLGPSSTKYFTFGGLSSLTAGRTVTIPDANTNTVQPLGSGTAHRWISYIDNTGTQNLTQPAIGDISGITFSGNTTELATVSGAVTSTHVATWDASGNLVDGGAAVTSSSTNTFTNKSTNAEGTGNTISVPAKALFPAAGCSGGSTAAPALVTGSTNTPTPQCVGSTVPKGVLQFARGNAAYISSFQLPSDWNSGASTDIQICFTTTDTTNGHVTSFNVQTGFNIVNGTATDDPALNSSQAASVTTGASQVSGGQLCATLTSMTMTGSVAGYNMEVAITRNNSGTDTNTDTAVAVKYATLTFGRSMNAANR